jgi:hypothetical protein
MRVNFIEDQQFEATAIGDQLTQAGASETSVSVQNGDGTVMSITSSSSSTPPSTGLNDLKEMDPVFGAEISLSNSSSQATAAQDVGTKPRFLLLCVDTSRIGATGKYRAELSNIDVSSSTVWNDQLLFNKIRENYYAKRPRKRFSLRTPKPMYFVQVSKPSFQKRTLTR